MSPQNIHGVIQAEFLSNKMQDFNGQNSVKILTLCMLDNFSCFNCRLLTFSKNFFSKNHFRNTISVNGLDPDQDRHNVGPDLGPSCFQWLSADDLSHHWQLGKI